MKKILFILSLIVATNTLFASDNVKAKDLFEKSKQKMSLKNVSVLLDLETTDNKGNVKSKALSVSFGEFNQEKKVMVEIIAPEKVKGTKILTTNYLNKKGVIEIYMPATGKIRKFRASNRNLKLMGSEIPIAQFSSVIDEDYSFTLLTNQKVNGIPCYRIKVYKPQEKTYRIAFVSITKEYLLKVEKYDSNEKLISFTEMSDYIDITNSKNKVYPKQITVRNLKTEKKSDLRIRQLIYVDKLGQDKFQITEKKSF